MFLNNLHTLIKELTPQEQYEYFPINKSLQKSAQMLPLRDEHTTAKDAPSTLILTLGHWGILGKVWEWRTPFFRGLQMQRK